MADIHWSGGPHGGQLNFCLAHFTWTGMIDPYNCFFVLRTVCTPLPIRYML